MNKKEFMKIYKTLHKGEITAKEAIKDIEIFLETIEESLKKEKKVSFVKIGVFELVERKAKNISNPSTRELMTTKAMKTVKFRTSKNIYK